MTCESSSLWTRAWTRAVQFIPLRRGRIGIEIEFAEIWYRRIDVKAGFGDNQAVDNDWHKWIPSRQACGLVAI